MVEENAKISNFTKLMPYNNPKYLIFVGAFSASVTGFIQAWIALPFSEYMSIMTASQDMLAYMGSQVEPVETADEYFDYNYKRTSLLIGVVGIISFGFLFWQKYAFGIIGENVGEQFRAFLYKNILQKNIGFFDDRENGPSVLTSMMASETSLINGVGSESIAP
jgi:ABC-type multidrug transport system fused ATPase/permease subunit